MEKSEINVPFFSSCIISNGGDTFRSPVSPLQPNFSSRAVQVALEHLATIDLSELVNEAKSEHCRAARDLRNCGRYVQYALNSCGHASLYAGLISRRCDERFQEKEDGNNQLTADVQRLYSFFDVALESNLASLICHYVTDICMDETAVASDAVTALLLDEKVVKDWVKWTFKNMATELQRIYYLELEEMKNRLGSFLKFSVHMASLSNVLEVLDSSFKGRLSAQLHDLHNLQDSILKTKQGEWQDVIHLKVFELLWTSSFYMVLLIWWLRSKQWPEEEWRDIIDDFAVSFGISRHSLLESFTFCLLDDHSHEALLECHQLLPEILGPETHPKIAQVLLERQNPRAAQMVILGSGRDGGSQMVSLGEAVTIVRVKVEGALLTEAFAYQRMICTKAREKKVKYEPSRDAFDDLKSQCRSWMEWIEVLVTELFMHQEECGRSNNRVTMEW